MDETVPRSPDSGGEPPQARAFAWVSTDPDSRARITILSSDVTAGAARVSFAPDGGREDPRTIALSPIDVRGLVMALTGDHGALDKAAAAYSLAARLQSPAAAEFLTGHVWDGFPEWSAHGTHEYYHSCAICRGDILAILAALARWIVQIGTEAV